ncbi:MAG: hypothetical protein LWY06_14875 [Firmicutes bacterium]|nr:hypothetical protein [Bacillota bacterium]
MAECEALAGCPFFNDKMAVKTILSGFFKKKYCLGSNNECARFMVRQALGKDNVPPDLFPNQTDEAELLIQSNAKAQNADFQKTA